MFKHWATPVTSTRWAIACVVLDTIKRASGYRLAIHSSHSAWLHATGQR